MVFLCCKFEINVLFLQNLHINDNIVLMIMAIQGGMIKFSPLKRRHDSISV